MTPHSSTLAWKIPWTEELGRLQSTGSLGAGHDWATSLSGIGEGNGNPLQCSCLENPRDGGIYLCDYLLSLVLLIFSCGFKLVTVVLLFQSEEFPLVLLVGRVWKWQMLSFLSENVFNFSVGLCFILNFQYVWNSWFIVFYSTLEMSHLSLQAFSVQTRSQLFILLRVTVCEESLFSWCFQDTHFVFQ